METLPAPAALPTHVEAFALELATCGNAVASYRRTHLIEGRSAHALEVAAHALRRRPEVARRVDELRLIGARAVLDKAALMHQDLFDIGYAADAHELSGLRWVNCRRCHGVDGEPAWIDGNEFADAIEKWIAEGKQGRGPSAAGGFGFKVLGEPNPDCRHCGGEGVPRPFFVDTRKLEGPARKLFRGVRAKANGDVELELEDRAKARDQLHKLLGLIVDKRITGHVNIDPTAPDPWSGASLSPEQILERVLRARRVESVVDAQFVEAADTDERRECDQAGPPAESPPAAVVQPQPARRLQRPFMVGPPR